MHPIRRFFFASAGAVYWLLARGASAQTQLLINQALKALGGWSGRRCAQNRFDTLGSTARRRITVVPVAPLIQLAGG